MVNCDASYTEHPKVINGNSEVMIAVFGERGKHSRSAVGMNSLLWNLSCEIETIVEIQKYKIESSPTRQNLYRSNKLIELICCGIHIGCNTTTMNIGSIDGYGKNLELF